MAQIPLPELKSRFGSGDTPTGRDYKDLIDTLIAVLENTVGDEAIINRAISLDKLKPPESGGKFVHARSDGYLTKVTVTDGGSGYTSVPGVSFSGGGGSGAAATAVLNGDKVSHVILDDAGIGYTSAPTVTIDAPSSGSQAQARAEIAFTIDWQSAGGSQPGGSAGGDLTGTYPNPTIAGGAVFGSKVAQGGVFLNRLDPTNASDGNRIEFQNGEWRLAAAASPGNEQTRQLVSGAINPADIDPNDGQVDYPIKLAFPASDTTITKTHNLSGHPTQAVWMIEFLSSFAGYSRGDQVPIDYLVDPTDPKTPVVYPSRDGTNIYLRIERSNGVAVYHKTDTSNPLTKLFTPETDIALRGYVYRLEVGDGLGSFSVYHPAPQSLPGAGADAVFDHGFGTVPSHYRVVLICQTAEHGYDVGDEVAVDEFFDVIPDGSGGQIRVPAFVARVDNQRIRVRQRYTDIQTVPIGSPSNVDANITPSSWNIKAVAHRAVNVTPRVPASLAFEVTNPVGAISYNQRLHVFHYNRYNDNSYLTRIDMVSGNAAMAQEFTDRPVHHNMALHKLSDGTVRGVGASSHEVFSFNLENPSGDYLVYTTLPAINGDYTDEMSYFEPAVVDESGSGGTSNPDIYWIANDLAKKGGGYLTSLLMRQLIWNGSAYDLSNVGEIDLTNTNIVNSGALHGWGTQGGDVYLAAYNPVSQRLYVAEVGTGFLHIFKLDGTEALEVWWAAPDYTKLTYQKSISLPAMGRDWNSARDEHYSVEYDPTNGSERAIVLVRRGQSTRTGSVIYFPWVE